MRNAALTLALSGRTGDGYGLDDESRDEV